MAFWKFVTTGPLPMSNKADELVIFPCYIVDVGIYKYASRFVDEKCVFYHAE